MKVEIDFTKKQLTILEPITIKELVGRFEGLDITNFKIVSKLNNEEEPFLYTYKQY
jgi:hypothetical protein